MHATILQPHTNKDSASSARQITVIARKTSII